MITSRWIGIDFSGDHRQWRASCGNSNVWIAVVLAEPDGPRVERLFRVQDLAGTTPPFARLAALLRDGAYLAAGIDAPFSLPSGFMPRGGHSGLLTQVHGLACKSKDRPFPEAREFVEAVTGRSHPLTPPKPYRETEHAWQKRGLNVRSTLWAGARGGAAMTAACLTLLAEANRPIWPWARESAGLLVEAFPAAQLREWSLPHERYNGDDLGAIVARGDIIDGIRCRIRFGPRIEDLMRGSADALDAVLCSFAGMAISISEMRGNPDRTCACELEGFIAVHR